MCLCRTRLERTSRKMRSEIQEDLSEIDPRATTNHSKIHPKSTPDRRKIDFVPFWTPKATSGMCLDAFGAAFGRPTATPKPILGRPGRARRRPKASPKHPKDAPRASGTAPKTLATLFAPPNADRSACGSIFDRFSVNVRKLRSAFRIGFTMFFRCRTFCASVAHRAG